MKKIILLFLLSSTFAFSQVKKAVVPKHSVKIETKELTIEQYDFLKTIKFKYPTFPINNTIDNIYIDNQLMQSQYLIEGKTGTLSIIIQPNNKVLDYEFELVNIGLYKGQYLFLGETVVKTELIEGKEFNVYFDGVKEL